MRSKVCIVTLAVIILLVPFMASAEEIVFATDITDSPPGFYYENGQHIGILTDIVREACNRIGIVPGFKRFPWKRAVKSVQTGETDGIFAVFRNEERTGFLYYPDEPLGTVKVFIFARKGTGMKVTAVTDLKGKSVAVNSGYLYGNPEFDKYEGAKKVECHTCTDQVRLLDKGRVDFVVTDEDAFLFTAKKLGLKDKFERVYFISESPWYAAFSQKALGEKGNILAEKFGNTLRQLKEEGVIQQITDKYLGH